MLLRISGVARAHVMALSLIVSFAGRASASDWYVDALNGDNANSGASPTAAWKTISFAVSSVPAGSVQTINIAPGLYNQALGELFPIQLRPDQQLIGRAGGPRPIVAADNLNVPLIRIASTQSNPAVFTPQTRVQHLVLRRAGSGIEIVTEAGEARPQIIDVSIEQTLTSGVSIKSWSGINAPTLERVSILPAVTTQFFECLPIVGSPGHTAVVNLRECKFVGSSMSGVSINGDADVALSRCQFDQIAEPALRMQGAFGATSRIRCEDSVFTYGGFVFEADSGGGHAALEFVRCTLAQNNDPSTAFAVSGSLSLQFDQCIVSASGAALVSAGNVNASAIRSLISDGSFDGVNGCFSGDPGFRDGLNGDFRLRWGSPCIDAAFADAPAGARDVVGAQRVLDGDLDTLGKTDLGAYEFQPLELTTSGAIGSSFTLENWGPQNSPSTIYWARAGLAGSQPTPFGAFQLNSQLARTFRVSSAGASAPTLTQRTIPNQLALVGSTFSFQALTDSSASPLSRAFTNGVEFTVTP